METFAARPRQELSGLRLATVIVLGLEIAAATILMPLFALVLGLWSWLREGGDATLPLLLAATWIETVGGGIYLIWRLASGRPWRSAVGIASNAVWAVGAVVIGIVGFPFLSPFGLTGLAVSVLLLILALREPRSDMAGNAP